MEREKFETEKARILADLAKKSVMVLATGAHGIVTARSVSVITHGDKIYFQTGKGMEKMTQIAENKNIALCCDNYQIKGEAKDLGSWVANADLLPLYIKKHENSYKLYGKMKAQIVVEITIKEVKRWDYINKIPYIAWFDFINTQFLIEEYKTV